MSILQRSAVIRNLSWRSVVVQQSCVRCTSSTASSLMDILRSVQENKLDLEEARKLISLLPSSDEVPVKHYEQQQQSILKTFANLDHDRALRTGFPEAVFAEGKTAQQVALILDDMARKVNEESSNNQSNVEKRESTANLATRVTCEMFEELSKIPLQQGTIEYHETARIVTMHASSSIDASSPTPSSKSGRRIVVATAGTTDLPIAEEAAVTLEAAGCPVDRIFDAGVAGLHRIVQAIPRLRHPDVGAVIVCAGMDGALPSVVGGLVSVPVIAVPTSVGYGASFGGISALLTMLNSCSPGVGIVNIDNGFGAAALAFKCVQRKQQ